MIIKRERSPLAIILLAVLLVVIACVSLTFGQIDVPVGKALAVIGSQLNLPGFTEADYSREQLAVIWYIRLPRMLVGVLVGAALGISGAVMQGIFSNPLADPGLIVFPPVLLPVRCFLLLWVLPPAACLLCRPSLFAAVSALCA